MPGQITAGLAGVIMILSGLLYWQVQRSGSLSHQLSVSQHSIKASESLRKSLEAALTERDDRITEIRAETDTLKSDLEKMGEQADESYRECRSVPLPDDIRQRLHSASSRARNAS